MQQLHARFITTQVRRLHHLVQCAFEWCDSCTRHRLVTHMLEVVARFMVATAFRLAHVPRVLDGRRVVRGIEDQYASNDDLQWVQCKVADQQPLHHVCRRHVFVFCKFAALEPAVEICSN